MRAFALIVIILVSSIATAVEKQENFIINVVESSVTEQRRQILEAYFTKLYQPLGITPTFEYLPSHRGLVLVNEGVFDAEAARFDSVARAYSNLIKIKEPLTVIRPVLFCLTSEGCRFAQNVAIGIQKGFEGARHFCAQSKASCMFDTSPKILAKLMDEGVLTGLLLTQDEASQVICRLQSKSVTYIELSEYERPTYHWVHKKYATLLTELAQSAKRLNATEWYQTELGNWRKALLQCGKQLKVL